MKYRTGNPGIPGLAIAMAFTATACGQQAARPDAPPKPVRIRPVEIVASQGDLRYSATITADSQVPLAFRVGGYVQDIRPAVGAGGARRDVDMGDTVRKGDELAKIRQTDFAPAADQAAALQAEAEASFRKADTDFKRVSALFGSQSATKLELDTARLALDSAESRLKAARAGVGQADLAVGDAVMRSPIDGVVIARRIERGSLAAPGQVAFMVGVIDRVKVLFGVPDTVVNRIAKKQRLQLTTEALGEQTFTGEVTAIAPTADAQSRLFAIEVTVPNATRALKPGMIVTVSLPDPQRTGTTTVVPLTAIVKNVTSTDPTHMYAVFVTEGEGEVRTAALRAVTLGDVFGNMIAVTSGLAVGVPVIVSGATLVTSGERVRVVP